MQDNLKAILNTLREQYGVKRISKKHGTEYVAFEKESRIDVLRDLVSTLKADEKEKEFFSINSTRNGIAEAFFPEHAIKGWPKEKRASAYNAVWDQLDMVIAEMYPENIVKAPPLSRPLSLPKPAIVPRERVAEPLESVPDKRGSVLFDEEAAKLLGVEFNE